MKTVAAILIALALGDCLLCINEARATEDAQMAVREAYNLNIIDRGIGLYYACSKSLPQSLSVLIEGGWVPSNLVNLYNGERVSGDSTALGGYRIAPDGQGAVILTFNNGEEELLSTRYDSEILSPTTLGITREQAMNHLMISWAVTCLTAYEQLTGEIPSSIDELADKGFWPFQGALNFYTGQEMLFDSYSVGDMLWEFSPGHVSIHLWLPPSPEGNTRAMALEFPFTQW